MRESTGPTHFLSKYSGGYASKQSLPRILMKVILFQAGYEGLFSSACSISFLSRLSTRADHTNIPYNCNNQHFLSFVIFLWNTLSLIALNKGSSLHPPSKILLRFVVTTDLCVDFVSETSWRSFADELTLIDKDCHLCHYILTASFLLGGLFEPNISSLHFCLIAGTTKSMLFHKDTNH